MNPAATSRSWADRLTAKPDRPRGFYLQQVVLIALAMMAALVAAYMTLAEDGSILWLVGADILVILACGRTAARIVKVMAIAAGAAEGLLVILMLGVVVVAIPLLAPFFFVWNVIQAIRADEAGPGEDDGWL